MIKKVRLRTIKIRGRNKFHDLSKAKVSNLRAVHVDSAKLPNDVRINGRNATIIHGSIASFVETEITTITRCNCHYPKARWGGFACLLCLYTLRVYIAQGWYIITYGLAIYLLNLFLGFLSPAQDPELEGSGPLLPVKDGEHMFIRRVPEFKFW